MKRNYIKPAKFPIWAKVDSGACETGRYALCSDGIAAKFDASSLPYKNHIELSGFKASSIISYKINKNKTPRFYRFCVFPSLRIIPDDTRGALTYAFPGVNIKINKKKEQVERTFFNGILQFACVADGARIDRRFIIGNDKMLLIEEIKITAQTPAEVSMYCKKPYKVVKKNNSATEKEYVLTTRIFVDEFVFSQKRMSMNIDNEKTIYIVYSAEPITMEDVQRQIKLREAFLAESKKRLKITVPDEVLNRMLELTKIRASESIFETKNGLMHSPGGGQYYAALWTNDQCEYANPFFAYLGYDKAWEQSLNCYRMYAKLASPDRAVFTSIVAQGDGYWYGAGDRGDSAMYVYGFARYLLTTGDRENAQRYLSSLETACEYVMGKMNENGVIESDSDELENRFESGRANLSTAVISYDAFCTMSYLEAELGNKERGRIYGAFAEKIRAGIKSYFEDVVEGFETYRYCKEESRLRSWICLPLTVGIFDRTDGTIAALKSDKLKKPCGLLTRSGEKTYWDRSLLYALRGMFYAGRADDALEMLTEYTRTRLLGEHVPYPIEACPEGNAAHLSAESALYIRIFTEGILGFRPLGFRCFELRPNLPSAWKELKVSGFHYAGISLTINICILGEQISIEIPELSYEERSDGDNRFIISVNR